MTDLEQIKRDLWNRGAQDVLDTVLALMHDFEHLHELAEAAHAVNSDHSDEGAWMFLSDGCLDYESPGVPELSNKLAAALRAYGDERAAEMKERCARVCDMHAESWPTKSAERTVLTAAAGAIRN